MNHWIHSLAFKTITVQLLVLSVILAAVGVLQYYSIRQSIYTEAARAGETAVAIFREEIAAEPERLDSPTLAGVAERLSGKLVNVSRLRLMDRNGRVVADSAPLQLSGQTQDRAHEGATDSTIEIVAPLHGRYDPTRRTDVVGSISAQIDLTLADRQVRRAFLQSMLMLLGLIPMLWVIDYVVLGRKTNRRLKTLASAAASLAGGHYQTRANVGGRDEIGSAGRAFNHMASELEGTYARLQSEIAEREQIETRMARLNRELEGSVLVARHHNESIGILNELSKVLQACSSVGEAMHIIPSVCSKLLGESSGSVYLLHSSRDHLERVVEFGEPEEGERYFGPDECWALRLGKTHLSRTGAGLMCPHIRNPDAGFEYQCAPLLGHSDTLGIFHVRFPAAGDPASFAGELAARDLKVIAISEQIGSAVANLNLRETLRQQSIRDPLTGLFNRRYLEETMQREMDRAVRTGGHLSVIMLDVDHFKRLNDSFGHDAGDQALRLLARVLASHTRSSDIACRFGGEEFVLLLPNASLEDAAAKAEQLRRSVADLDVEFSGRDIGPLTISLGVAAVGASTTVASSLLKRADEALFDAKAQGRDRVVVSAGADAL